MFVRWLLPFSHRLLKVLERGILLQLERKYFELDLECSPERVVPLRFRKVVGLFGVAAAGAAAAIATLACEGALSRSGRTTSELAAVSMKNRNLSAAKDEFGRFVLRWKVGSSEDLDAAIEELEKLREAF